MSTLSLSLCARDSSRSPVIECMAPRKRRRNPAIEDRPCRGCTILSNRDLAQRFVERLHPLRHSLGAFNAAARELQSDVQYASTKVRHDPEEFDLLADRTCRNTLSLMLHHPDGNDDREIPLRYCRFQNKNAMGGPCQRFVHPDGIAEGRHVCVSHSTRVQRPIVSSSLHADDLEIGDFLTSLGEIFGSSDELGQGSSSYTAPVTAAIASRDSAAE